MGGASPWEGNMWEGPLGGRSFYLQLHIKPDSVLFRGPDNRRCFDKSIRSTENLSIDEVLEGKKISPPTHIWFC